MKRLLLFIMILSLIICIPGRTVSAGDKEPITSKDQLNKPGKKIGVGVGSAAMAVVENELPEAELVYIEMNEGLQALEQGKIDAYIYDRRQLTLALKSGNINAVLLDQNMDEKVHVAAGISPVTKIDGLENTLNEFIDTVHDDGTLDDMFSRWVLKNDYDMPEISKPQNPKTKLIVGTTGIVTPYSFYKGDELYGYDIELAKRFALYLDASLEFKVYDYGSIINAAASGDVDCILANLNVTPERAQALTFSHDLYTEDIGIAVKGTGGGPELKSFEDLGGKRVSMLTGAPFEELVRSFAPDVAEFSYYNNMPDILLALKQGKTDAILQNNALADLAVNRDNELAHFPEILKESTFGIAFAKEDDDIDQWQQAYDAIPKETLEELWQKWTGSDNEKKVPIEQDWAGEAGTVKVAACDSLEPMSYLGQSGKVIGFDADIVLLMAKEMDVKVEFVPMEFAAILSYVQSGKAKMGIGSIIVTDERREAVDFIEYYPAAFVLVVRRAKAGSSATSFWNSVKSSFEKTFIRENRWKLFVRGVLTTLLITVMTVIFGTALGFLVYMLCRHDNRIANGITGAVMWLVQGMPMVVLLMILYYIIFGKVSVSGIIISIIGFTLTFASSVIGLLRLGVGAVDKGQYEAAYSLGYPDLKIFFRIILPQALPHVMNSYKGEIVGLIKATAIVGYIAVQDLTKVGDIVRSRTYDAFFPLIAIAVIYFVLEGLLGMIISRIDLRLDYRNRKIPKILKGVRLNDKD
ncbi:transporter substrate-binding domain-containing protein [Butyrivibrio sp. WCD2001]|uniref:transporter substrate-binding domain-containing protein n=1 Tax=Butyrivibrio sp. WCD2001 TaxID=1280681 RepID=UPI0004278C05|nr:transporter substrate-binding domain-containing protein [Butyrivibrio sp. WCD2001]